MGSHRPNWVLQFSSVVLLGGISFSAARADDVPDLNVVLKAWNDYMAWASVLEGEVTFEQSNVSGEEKKTSRIVSRVYLDMDRGRMLMLGQPDSGANWVDGVNEDYKFLISKQSPTNKDWVIDDFSRKLSKQYLIGALHTTCQGFVVLNRLLPAIVKSPEVVVGPIERTTSGDREVLKLQFAEPKKGGGFLLSAAIVTLDAKEPYLPLELDGKFMSGSIPGTIRIKNAYDYDKLTNPTIKQQDVHTEYVRPDGVGVNQLEIRRINLAPLSLKEPGDFKLAAFGVAEPGRPSGKTALLLAILNIAVIALIVTVIFFRRKERRKE